MSHDLYKNGQTNHPKNKRNSWVDEMAQRKSQKANVSKIQKGEIDLNVEESSSEYGNKTQNRNENYIIPNDGENQTLLQVKYSKFKAESTSVNIGMWLYERGHFDQNKTLMLYWTLTAILTLAIQIYFVYLGFEQADVISTIKVMIGVDQDREAQHALVCESGQTSQWLGMMIIFVMVISSLDQKIVLYLQNERSCLFKVYLMAQILVSLSILWCAYFHQIKESNMIDLLLNVLAFLFLNDFDSYSGQYFKKHIKVHYSEITSDEEFLKFKFNKLEYRTWYSWSKQNLLLFIILALVDLPLRTFQKCMNFETWFDKRYTQKTLYKNSIGAAIGDGVIFVLSACLLIGTILPFIVLKVMQIFRSEQEDKKEAKQIRKQIKKQAQGIAKKRNSTILPNHSQTGQSITDQNMSQINILQQNLNHTLQEHESIDFNNSNNSERRKKIEVIKNENTDNLELKPKVVKKEGGPKKVPSSLDLDQEIKKLDLENEVSISQANIVKKDDRMIADAALTMNANASKEILGKKDEKWETY